MFFNVYALPLFASGILMLLSTFYSWRLRDTAGAKEFVLVILACAVYTLGYALEISSISLEMILFWLKVEYLGISLLPPFFVIFALVYTGRSNKLSLFLLASLFVIPLVTLLLVFTMENHALYYRAMELDGSGLFPVLSFERGPWYWVHSAYMVVSVLFSNILFLLMWWTANQVYRRQIAMVLAGSLIPWGVNLFYQAFHSYWNLDINPFALIAVVLFFFLGLFRYRLFDLSPVARTTLFEELPDGVLVLDRELRLVDFNLAANKYLQVMEDAIGKPVKDVLHDWPELARLAGDETGTLQQQLQREVMPNTHWFRVEIYPLRENDGTARGKMILLRDITVQKEAEEALKESEAHERELSLSLKNMEELNRLKANFLSTVSHELRTPLTSILGFVKIINKRLEEVIFPQLNLENKKNLRAVRQVQGNLDIVTTEANRLTNIINNLLDLAMLDADQVEWKKAPVDFKSVARQAVAAVDQNLQKKGLSLTLELEEELPVITGDEMWLLQLMVQLLSNGIKFTDEGEIRIGAAYDGAADEIVVAVKDTGRGVPPEAKETIFEKFKQVGDLLTDKPKGTGLGLPICREIVERHGGRIWLESEPGEGSTFYFSLPAH